MSVKYHACPGCIPLPYFQSCLCFPYCSGLSSELLNNQTWHIYWLLAFRTKLPKPTAQELKSPFSLPSPFFPPVVARALLHFPCPVCPASPAAPAPKAQQFPPFWEVFAPWSPPKPAPGPCFSLCPSSPHPQTPAWTPLHCGLSPMEPHPAPPLPKISSLQVLLLSGAFASSGCCTALAESLSSPNPLTLFCLVNAKEPGFLSGIEGSSSA